MRRQKKGFKQAAWNYMRRNKIFCVKDIITVTGIDLSYLKNFLYHLQRVGYIKTEDMDKNYKNRCYRLLKDTGPIVPKTNKGEVYDYNLKKTILFTSRLEAFLHQLLQGIEAEEFLNEYLNNPLLLIDIKSQIREAKKVDRLDLLEQIALKITKGL